MKVKKYLERKQLLKKQQLVEKVDSIRAEGKTIVTLNGSFDLLHAGHLHMLFEAASQGDVLIVAVNSDASIKQYKSLDRPIIPLQERMEMLSAISFVDYVTPFDETDPLQVLELIKPDVHVNGSEYGADCLEAPLIRKQGGRLHIVELIPGLSTTQILEKISSCV